MILFENGSKCGDYLEKAYSLLMTLKLTSVEAEQPFSSTGLFSTKICSR